MWPFSSVQSLSRVRLFVTPWTAVRQASLSITNSQSLLKLRSIESMMPSNHLIPSCPLLLPPSIDVTIRKCELGQTDFPGDSDCKESACNAGDLGSIPGLGRSPGGGHGNSLQYPCLENPHGQRSLAGYSPWGCKQSGTTDWLSTVHGR